MALSRRVDLAPGPGGARISPVVLIGDSVCEWLHATWPRWLRVQMIALYPSSQLVAHCDAPIDATRYHIPLVVNPGCWVFHDGTWQQLEVGTVYQMDPTRTHGAVNWGAEVRLHLIVDVA